jgi:adenosylhomocysteinase
LTEQQDSLALAKKGELSYKWASSHMGIVDKILKKYYKKKPLHGYRLGFCLHLTKETSVIAVTAKKLGAEISICSANPLSVKQDISAFLRYLNIDVYATANETQREYQYFIRQVIESRPDIITDDGAELHFMAHKMRAKKIIGGTEETTSGVMRLKNMYDIGILKYPVIAVNQARTKHMFDNRYGTGQSTIDGIMRATGLLITAKHVVVCGYGWVGKGVAARARGMGARVTVTEVDAIKALEAHMDGYDVKPLTDVAHMADIFITCTGQTTVIDKDHISLMKDGAILANAGHFDVEINVDFLNYADNNPITVRENVQSFNLNGKHINLLCAGRVVNLVSGEGHPPEVMDLSFANQILSIIYVANEYNKLEKRVLDVPDWIDYDIAKYALKAARIKIDKLTNKQVRYGNSPHG